MSIGAAARRILPIPKKKPGAMSTELFMKRDEKSKYPPGKTRGTSQNHRNYSAVS